MAIPYLLGHDIFRALGVVAEITDPYPTNQKSACLFLSVSTCLGWNANGGTIPLTKAHGQRRPGGSLGGLWVRVHSYFSTERTGS
jgi:hypothetical protein